MTPDDQPQCPWCDAANTLDAGWSEMGSTYCHCTCCGKRCYVDRHGAHRTPEPDVRDVNGIVIYGD